MGKTRVENRLKRMYYFGIIPAVLMISATQAARLLGMKTLFHPPEWTYGAIFILAALSALAGPIALRTWFAHTHRTAARVPSGAFFTFQIRLLCLALVTPYLAAVALILDFPRFHASGIVLLALYAAYYHCPSARRIAFDKKIFRVREDHESQNTL